MIPWFTYSRPNSLKDAVKQLSVPGTRLHAGGTDLLGCLRDGVVAADKLVSISHLAELRGITRTGNGSVRIGALTTLTEIAEHPYIMEHYAALSQGASSAASPQLRNQGTIGGNISQRPRCWYFRGDFHCLRKGGEACYAVAGENQFHCIVGGQSCFIVHPSDTAPALVALEARVRITGPQGTRTLPLESFFVGPQKDFTRENVLDAGDILTEILLPAPAANHRSSYRKVRARGAWDFALAGVALSVRFSNGIVQLARIVLSGVAPVPWRVREAEKIVTGKEIDDETASQAAAACVKDAVPLAKNEYKLHLVRGVVEEALLAMKQA